MPRVLLVENNVLNRKMLDRRLQHCGFDMVTAADGDKGVSIAIEQQPDLIIMATELPVMDGWQAIKILKASGATAHIPIIALTTNAKSGNWKTALKVGCNDYDTKPVVLKRLIGKVNALLGVAESASSNASSDNVTSSVLPQRSLLPEDALSDVSSPKQALAEIGILKFKHLETKMSGGAGPEIGLFSPGPFLEASSDGLLNGRYEITQLLSSSPFGQCLLAKDLKAPIAKSVILNTFNLPVDNPSLLSLVREALGSEMSFLRVVTRQDDIATCLDSFEQGGIFYWVQSHVVGTSLADELGSAQSLGHVLQLTQSLLSAVHPFHQGKMVHCECNPNSFIRRQSDNRIVLVEYGVLKRIFVNLRSHSLTYRQALLKHHEYQPAEQRVGNPQLNSDIYSIGMIVLQSLTGQSPSWLVTTNGQRSLTDLVKADSTIVKLFERMINPNYHLRFNSAGEVLKELPLGLIPKKNTYRRALSS